MISDKSRREYSMHLHIDITIKDERWKNLSGTVQNIFELTLQIAAFKGKNIEISLVLANDNFVRELNKNYRGKNKPTNILSFPQIDKNYTALTEEPQNLGDIVLALETIEKESCEQEKNFNDHLTHLLVHGTLHLIGYDHIKDKEAKEMESLEIRILEKLNIKNPYRCRNSL